MFGGRFVIPEGLRTAIMTLAHERHPGQKAFQDTLHQRVWWPAMTKDESTYKYVERCSECWRRRTNSPQELQPTEVVGVRRKLAVDIASIEGHSILSIVHYGSRYPILKTWRSTTSASVINELDEVFSAFGLPETLVSDNGPQFVSGEMSSFLSRLTIAHVRSSPRHARVCIECYGRDSLVLIHILTNCCLTFDVRGIECSVHHQVKLCSLDHCVQESRHNSTPPLWIPSTSWKQKLKCLHNTTPDVAWECFLSFGPAQKSLCRTGTATSLSHGPWWTSSAVR